MIPPKLREKLEAAYLKLGQNDNGWCEYSGWHAGAEALWSMLLEQAPEFDEATSMAEYGTHAWPANVTITPRSIWIEGARWQHAQLSDALAGSRLEAENWRLYAYEWTESIGKYEREVAQQETELRTLREKLTWADAENSNAIERIAELERDNLLALDISSKFADERDQLQLELAERKDACTPALRDRVLDDLKRELAHVRTEWVECSERNVALKAERDRLERELAIVREDLQVAHDVMNRDRSIADILNPLREERDRMKGIIRIYQKSAECLAMYFNTTDPPYPDEVEKAYTFNLTALTVERGDV